MEENVRKKLDTKIITPVLVPLEEQRLIAYFQRAFFFLYYRV